MKVVSVNVGRPVDVTWRGAPVRTGIWKEAVSGRVAVRRHNLEGDGQADLTVHGGRDKAVYAYALGHYDYWRAALRLAELPYGAFGENLTLDDFSEDAVRIGDQYLAGTARLLVTQPRLPCHKLGVRFGRADMPDRFLASGRTGFYMAVLEEGTVEAGDDVRLLGREPAAVTIAEATRLYAGRDPDPALLRRALDVPALPEGWRARFRKRLEKADSRD